MATRRGLALDVKWCPSVWLLGAGLGWQEHFEVILMVGPLELWFKFGRHDVTDI